MIPYYEKRMRDMFATSVTWGLVGFLTIPFGTITTLYLFIASFMSIWMAWRYFKLDDSNEVDNRIDIVIFTILGFIPLCVRDTVQALRLLYKLRKRR